MLPHIYRFNHRIAFYKQADEPFIEAPNPYDDKQGWLKNQNNLLVPIWQVGPILPSALADIVGGRGGIEDTTFEAKANNLKQSEAKNRLIKTDPLKAKGRNGRGQGQRHNFPKL